MVVGVATLRVASRVPTAPCLQIFDDTKSLIGIFSELGDRFFFGTSDAVVWERGSSNSWENIPVILAIVCD